MALVNDACRAGLDGCDHLLFMRASMANTESRLFRLAEFWASLVVSFTGSSPVERVDALIGGRRGCSSLGVLLV